ncbi:MAG: hypothetical protein Q9222_004518 [Ikaeria aurantiellina]
MPGYHTLSQALIIASIAFTVLSTPIDNTDLIPASLPLCTLVPKKPSSDQSLTLYNVPTDFGDKAQDICDEVLQYKDGDGSNRALLPIGESFTGTNVQRARVKVAQNIWHKGSVRIDTMIENLGMDPTVENQQEAHALCMDSVSYAHDQCTIGFQGLVGSSPHVKEQYYVQKDGSVGWADNDPNVADKKIVLRFSFSMHRN